MQIYQNTLKWYKQILLLLQSCLVYYSMHCECEDTQLKGRVKHILEAFNRNNQNYFIISITFLSKIFLNIKKKPTKKPKLKLNLQIVYLCIFSLFFKVFLSCNFLLTFISYQKKKKSVVQQCFNFFSVFLWKDWDLYSSHLIIWYPVAKLLLCTKQLQFFCVS